MNITQKAIDYINSSIVGPFVKGFSGKPGEGATSNNPVSQIGDAIANGPGDIGPLFNGASGLIGDATHAMPLALGVIGDKSGALFGNALRNAGKLAPDTSMINGISLKDLSQLLVHPEPLPLDPARVQYYKDLINQGQAIDPLQVIQEGNKFGVEDGKHRLQALQDLGFRFAPTQVIQR